MGLSSEYVLCTGYACALQSYIDCSPPYKAELIYDIVLLGPSTLQVVLIRASPKRACGRVSFVHVANSTQ